MHADVRDMRRHNLDGSSPADLEKFAIAGRIVLQDRAAELKTLRPLSPASAGVGALNCEDR